MGKLLLVAVVTKLSSYGTLAQGKNFTPSDWVNSIAISPDGQTLASGSKDGTIKMWNPRTMEEIYTLMGHSDFITSVAISPDGKTLASASGDTAIKPSFPILCHQGKFFSWVLDFILVFLI